MAENFNQFCYSTNEYSTDTENWNVSYNFLKRPTSHLSSRKYHSYSHLQATHISAAAAILTVIARLLNLNIDGYLSHFHFAVISCCGKLITFNIFQKSEHKSFNIHRVIWASSWFRGIEVIDKVLKISFLSLYTMNGCDKVSRKFPLW